MRKLVTFLSRLNLNLRKEAHIMEIIRLFHDLAFALVIIAIVMSPHAINTYLTMREAKNDEATE